MSAWRSTLLEYSRAWSKLARSCRGGTSRRVVTRCRWVSVLRPTRTGFSTIWFSLTTIVIAWTSSGMRIGTAVSFLGGGGGQTGAVCYALRLKRRRFRPKHCRRFESALRRSRGPGSPLSACYPPRHERADVPRHHARLLSPGRSHAGPRALLHDKSRL